MTPAPLSLLALGWSMTALVVGLAGFFLLDSERALAFTQHDVATLPLVMVDRFFVFFMFMGAALVSQNPGWIAYAFAVTGAAALWNAWIYRKVGKPYRKHLVTGGLSAIVAGWAYSLTFSTGAA